MLLTLYYVAATWVQSWRLSAMRARITQLLGCQGSLVLYKEPPADPSEVQGPLMLGVSSSCCTNRADARVGDLLLYADGKRACSVFPEVSMATAWASPQTISNMWTCHAGSAFAVKGEPSPSRCEDRGQNSAMTRGSTCLWRLTTCTPPASGTPTTVRTLMLTCLQLEQFGTLRVWQAGDVFRLILETDVEHLTTLGSRFMTGTLSIDDGMELVRIQSIKVEGRPCLMLHTESIPVTRSPARQGEEAAQRSPGEWRVGVQMSPVQWRSHLELLQSFTQAAKRVTCGEEQVLVGGHTSAALVAGTQPLGLHSPTVIAVPEAAGPHEEKSIDSFYSLTEEMDDEMPTKNGPSPIPEEEQPASPSTVSVTSHCKVPPRQVRAFSSSASTKPPNVLVYSESSVALDNARTVLHATLQPDRYTIYPVSQGALLQAPWAEHTALLVVCGSLAAALAPAVLGFLLRGGRVLCLCSDLLSVMLPAFHTAEVRERELVRFSYARWHQVRLLHHIFCYQASPARSRFSPKEAQQPPTSVQVQDAEGHAHTLRVQVLGAEETWHTPSLLLASVSGGEGCVVFSQVHLEVDPAEYDAEESNTARLEILADLLSTHLGLVCSTRVELPAYTPGYFLGRHEAKLQFLVSLKSRLEHDNTLQLTRLSLQFCTAKGVESPRATAALLPILVHACPTNFSTIEYFDSLQSEVLGRLVIFSQVMSSSMDVLTGARLQHGLAVVPCVQTRGAGRGDNVWLSPEGCAMFSLQLHLPLASYLGQHISLLQHVVALALVTSVCGLPGYDALDLRLKWPNDVYAGSSAKLGGLVVHTVLEGATAVCNVGLGVNLDNRTPTTCINEMVAQLDGCPPPLSRERLLALTFTQLEVLLNAVQTGQVQHVLDQYYSFWLHTDAEITVVGPRGSSQKATVIGVDDFGFLKVRGQDGAIFSVHPDGNSFDMLQGLVAPTIK
ncbi:biotin--protein ligase isoform X2 [Periplaneta americana]|uniref:biotin--protein ligase isoform X2 n=1 Tax=Periplaneta americana TaxID=6978 RepID=UPI0037E7DEDE